MPPAIVAVATAISAAVGGFVAAAAGSIALGGLVANVVFDIVEVSIYIGISVLAQLALAPKVPSPGSVQTPIKQPVSARRSAFGRVRVSGVYALFEAKEDWSVDVLALLDGESEAFVDYYLNDDKVTFGSGTQGAVYVSGTPKFGGGPPGHKCFIYSRLGLATETAYSQVGTHIAAWDAAHRGDGVTSLALLCEQSKAKDQQTDWPNGVPAPSAVIDAQKLFDPRTGTYGDRSTYVWSDNPVLALLGYITDAAGGMGEDYTRRILPTIAAWIAAADDCDAAEATDTGTETRYRCAGTYQHDNAPGDVIARILETFDGFLAERGDGALMIWSGRYVAPTVSFTDRQVLSYSVQHFLPDEQATNQYIVTFTDPDNAFNTSDAGPPVEDAADISTRGVIRSTTLDLAWVPSASQAIRLAKRRLDRSTQPLRGVVTTNLMGLAALGERYLHLAISDNAALADLVVEVDGAAQIDLGQLTITFNWIAANATIDAGDPGASVTPPATPPSRPVQASLVAPTITTLTALYEDASAGAPGARLQIDVTAPVDANVQWLARWKLHAANDWHESVYSDIDDGPAIVLVTGFVTAVGEVDVQVAYATAGAVSPWSATDSITLDTPLPFGRAVTASQTLAAGDLVNLHTVTGALRMRKADATDTTKPAHGFVRAGVASAAAGTFYGPGQINDAVAGLTPGATYWLSATPPSTSTNGDQEVGQALSATELLFAPKMMVEAP
jgi:hypothetical protein